MDRKQFVQAVLSSGNGAAFTPVQVQKLFFLIDRNISDLIGGPYFDFQPYDYGPFDKAVYEELDRLEEENNVAINSTGRWNIYQLTPIGQAEGKSLLQNMDTEARDYILEASEFVRNLSFTELVSAIYNAYPEMKVNSVFQF